MEKPLIAKPVVKNQFWIVTNGEEKVGNVIADGSGYELKLNGNKTHYKNTSTIQKQAHIHFETVKIEKPKKQEIPFILYPTTKKVYNSVLDIKRKIHVYTKTLKSKCYYAAGWYVLNQSTEPVVTFCPKYIFIQRYEYIGPFKTEQEAEKAINSK